MLDFISSQYFSNFSLGFRLVGVFSQCGFKFGRYFDMVFMEKHIGAHDATPSCYQEKA